MTTEKGLGKNSWEKEKERDGNTARKKYSKRERESDHKEQTNNESGGAAVAQWIHSRLPSCHPGFESQAHHLRFFQFKFEFKL